MRALSVAVAIALMIGAFAEAGEDNARELTFGEMLENSPGIGHILGRQSIETKVLFPPIYGNREVRTQSVNDIDAVLRIDVVTQPGDAGCRVVPQFEGRKKFLTPLPKTYPPISFSVGTDEMNRILETGDTITLTSTSSEEAQSTRAVLTLTPRFLGESVINVMGALTLRHVSAESRANEGLIPTGWGVRIEETYEFVAVFGLSGSH